MRKVKRNLSVCMSALGLHRAADRRTMWSTTENLQGAVEGRGKVRHRPGRTTRASHRSTPGSSRRGRYLAGPRADTLRAQLWGITASPKVRTHLGAPPVCAGRVRQQASGQKVRVVPRVLSASTGSPPPRSSPSPCSTQAARAAPPLGAVSRNDAVIPSHRSTLAGRPIAGGRRKLARCTA